jgi:hypothetical protein
LPAHAPIAPQVCRPLVRECPEPEFLKFVDSNMAHPTRVLGINNLKGQIEEKKNGGKELTNKKKFGMKTLHNFD